MRWKGPAPAESTMTTENPSPWNKGRLIGQKRPLKPKGVWTIRVRLQLEGRQRDFAMFNLAVDSNCRGCDLVRSKSICMCCQEGPGSSDRDPEEDRQRENLPRDRHCQSWLVVPSVWPIYRRMTRNGNAGSSNEEAAWRRDGVKRGSNLRSQRRHPPMPKPKERPASKGRVHLGRLETSFAAR
jgi:hypothetical protein